MADIEKIFNQSQFIHERHKAFAYALYVGVLTDKYLSKCLEQFDLPVNKYRILRGLAKVHPEGVGVYKLKEFLIVGDADISRLVDRLVKKGLVTRKPGMTNKSTMQVTITAEGLTRIQEVQSHLSEFIEPMMCFTEEEAAQLNGLLSKAIDSFAQMGQKLAQTSRP